MKRLAFGSWLGTALVLGVFVAACGDDDDGNEDRLRGSGEGESCQRSSDCENGLACVSNFCTASGSAEGGTDGGGPAPGPVLGREGESCTRRADCENGLLCIDQRCVDSVPADGGEGNVPEPRLGVRGDSCSDVSDCGPELTCIFRGAGGVCDLQDYGIEPTGKTCGGECLEAEDCCQLPRSLAITYGSCERLAASLGDIETSCPVDGTPAPALAALCFHYATYCDCAEETWECADNRCSYIASCTTTGETWNGCPSVSRTDAALATTTCIDGACAAAACEEDLDCEGANMADIAVPCTFGECICVQQRCYRSCDEDLDCPASVGVNHTCVEGACTQTPTCASDEQCKTALGHASAECREGTCVTPCAFDQDCSASGVGRFGVDFGFSGMVCGPDQTCQALGCSEHDECNNGIVRTFCTEPPPVGDVVVSATTD